MLSMLSLWAPLAAATTPVLDPYSDPDVDPAAVEEWLEGLSVDLSDSDDPLGVVGGKQANPGKWDDAVGVVFGGQYVGCTGTLVGPKVVLTAGHCVGGISHVLVGSTDWLSNEGEIIEVERTHEYPNSQATYDIAVLILESRASAEPRPIAVECVLRDYLEDGANAQIVGYGATTENGSGFNSKLNEAGTEVLDKNCDETYINGVYAGCVSGISPGGEIAAGGNGTDACFGDSGGPLYLKTGGDGIYVVGVTSRAFLGVNFNVPCRDGGIWVRPDAVIDWIEEVADGKTIAYPSCNEAPELLIDDIVTFQDVSGTTLVQIDDPDGDPDQATITVVVEPESGAVEVQSDGTLVYTPDAGFLGDDVFTVEVLDAGTDSKRTGDPVAVELDVDVTVQQGVPPEEGGSGRGSLGGCGCSSTSAPAGAVGLFAVLGLVGLRRLR